MRRRHLLPSVAAGVAAATMCSQEPAFASDDWALRDQGRGSAHCVESPHFTVCERLSRDGHREGEPIEIWWGDDTRPILRELSREPEHTTGHAVIDWHDAGCRFEPGAPGALVRSSNCDVVVRWTADLAIVFGGVLEIR